MATSGTYLFNPTLAEVLDEAFERAGLDPTKTDSPRIISARRSLNFLFQEWVNTGIKQWATELLELQIIPGQARYVLPVGTVDIFSMTYVREDFETPMQPMGRKDYHHITDKDLRGIPTMYFVEMERDQTILYIWETGEFANDKISYYRMRHIQDATKASEHADTPWRYQDAMCNGLALRLARKWSPEKVEMLEMDYAVSMRLASITDRERGPTYVNPSVG